MSLSTSLESDWVGLSTSPPVTIRLVAAAGVKNYSLMALACSNDFLVFRYVDEGGVPIVRQLLWPEGPMKRVVAMDFNPTAQLLCCVTGDSTVVLIPVYFLMRRRAEANPASLQREKEADKQSAARKMSGGGKKDDGKPTSTWSLNYFPSLMNYAQGNLASPKMKTDKAYAPPTTALGALDDVTLITCCTKLKPPGVSQCLWWNTSEGRDYGLIATAAGKVHFVDFIQQKEVYTLSLPNAVIDSLDIVVTDSYKYLLIQTRKGVCLKLLLEYRTPGEGRYESIISTPKSKANEPLSTQFLPVPLQQFPYQDNVSLGVQKTWQGCLVGAYHPLTHTYEVFGPDLGKFALFVYQLPSPPTQILLTERLTFVVSKVGEDASSVSVVSNWNAATSPEPHWFYKHHKDSVMQEFNLGPGQNILGVFRTNNSATLLRRSPQNPSTALEGFYMWTSDAVYQCVAEQTPENIFYSLIGKGLEKSEAESFGKTMALDMLTLYETAADKYFELGKYQRAFELYQLSNVEMQKLIQKFGGINRMDIVLTHLRDQLDSPQALSAGDKKSLSSTLLQSYLQCFLEAPQHSNQALESDFRLFLRENEDYDPKTALELLHSHGLMQDFFIVARARRMGAYALRLLANTGSLHIEPKLIPLVREGGMSGDLKACEGGILVRCLPPKLQMKLILDDVSNIPFYFRRIEPILPLLDENMLLEVARIFDPLGDVAPKIYSAVARSDHDQTSWGKFTMAGSLELTDAHNPNTEEWAKGPEDFIELFLTTLLMLNHRRKRNEAHLPPKVEKRNLGPESEQDDGVSSGGKLNVPFGGLVSMRQVVNVSCGWNHCAALTENGHVYTWGRNGSGELGHGDKSGVPQLHPKQVIFFKSKCVKEVVCGGEHTLARTESGSVYGWGNGRIGQLGLGDRTLHWLPVPIKTLRKMHVTQLAAGYAHTIVVLKSGEVMVFGGGEVGQLGTGMRKDLLVPTKLQAMPSIVQAACGYCHTALLTEAGEVYTCGSAMSGQLGHADNLQNDRLAPKMVEGLNGKRIRFIACGSFHTIAITDLDNVYTWGGVQGTDSDGAMRQERKAAILKRVTPSIVKGLMGKRISLVSCGHAHSVATTMDGEVYVWSSTGSLQPPLLLRGSGLSTAAASGTTEAPLLVSAIPDGQDAKSKPVVKHAAAGEEFTLVVTENGLLYSWGSGAFGQLGLGDQGDRAEIVQVAKSEESRRRSVSPYGDSLHSNRLTYGQNVLENTLRSHWEQFNSSTILTKCAHYQNWVAAAVVYEMLNCWSESIDCELRAIRAQAEHHRAHFTVEEARGHEMDSVFGVLKAIFAQKSETRKSKLLMQVLWYWHERGLEVGPLEGFLLANLGVAGKALAWIMQEAHTGAELPFAGLPFQRTFYETITRLRITRLQELRGSTSQAGAGDQQLSEESLWQQITATITTNWDKRSKITIPSTSLPALPAGRNVDDQELLVFSCDKNHIWTRQVFFETILPKFKTLIASLPVDLSITAQFLLAEYHLKTMRVACPLCVFNTLAAEQNAHAGAATSIRPWVE